MGNFAKWSFVLSLLVLAPAFQAAQGQPAPLVPRGIYTVVDINTYINQQQKANPSITTAELHASLIALYSSLLSNPAVSGLTIQIAWSLLNLNPPSDPQPYDWSYLDDAFSSVAAWNGLNPGAPAKTIQVQVFPGFFTPQWVFDQIPDCDGLFATPPETPVANCGKATFVGFGEPHDDLSVLPMPWNPFYKSSFQTFLMAFAAHYEDNPAFVSIDVAGPTAASTEMIETTDSRTPPQAQFGGITANNMWLLLLAFAYPTEPAYQKSDQAFIDEWNTAIDMFGSIFSGVTLVATTGDGLFNFGGNNFTIPTAFQDDCPTPNMDCAAETTILAHFVDPTVGGNNAKATQESGMNGHIAVKQVNLGVYSAKLLSQRTDQFTAPAAQILAGEQFGTGAANHPVEQGCTSSFPPPANNAPAGCVIPASCTTDACVPVACIPQACLAPGVSLASLASFKTFGNVPAADLIPPEQAIYDTLRNFFNGTPAAPFFGGTSGTAPLNYLQIYADDILYATANANAPAQVVQADGTIVVTTAQELLNLASQKLLAISEGPEFPGLSLWANTVVELDQSASLRAILSAPAPPGGVTISLTSSDPTKVTVTPSVFVPAGRTSANVPPRVTGVNVGSVTITATAPGYTADAQSVRVTATIAFARCCVTITGPPLNAVLNLSDPAPAGGLTVQLSSDNPSVATVPASITFAANATSVNVPITGTGVGATVVHASVPTLLDTKISVTVSSFAPPAGGGQPPPE